MPSKENFPQKPIDLTDGAAETVRPKVVDAEQIVGDFIRSEYTLSPRERLIQALSEESGLPAPTPDELAQERPISETAARMERGRAMATESDDTDSEETTTGETVKIAATALDIGDRFLAALEEEVMPDITVEEALRQHGRVPLDFDLGIERGGLSASERADAAQRNRSIDSGAFNDQRDTFHNAPLNEDL